MRAEAAAVGREWVGQVLQAQARPGMPPDQVPAAMTTTSALIRSSCVATLNEPLSASTPSTRAIASRASVSGGTVNQRRHKSGRVNVPVLGHHQRSAHFVSQVGFQASRLISVDERVRDAGRDKGTALLVELTHLRVIESDLKRPVSSVFDGTAGVPGHSRHEAVVLFEAADAEPQERA